MRSAPTVSSSTPRAPASAAPNPAPSNAIATSQIEMVLVAAASGSANESKRPPPASAAHGRNRPLGDAPDRIRGENAGELPVCTFRKPLEHAEHDSHPEPTGPDPLDEPRCHVHGQTAAEDEAEVADHHQRERGGEHGGRVPTLDTAGREWV